ncbi:hypothetical protein HNY73_002313 [Argiope bruennichi]|uniref:Uncharacterized protein n=1 Tax=Argiope bruennichi TaxID=94029 RepID=A0A8T0FUG4_ARGBR|nr:hypothetical protein HNY73_002313 [Argiope bruennichi]
MDCGWSWRCGYLRELWIGGRADGVGNERLICGFGFWCWRRGQWLCVENWGVQEVCFGFIRFFTHLKEMQAHKLSTKQILQLLEQLSVDSSDVCRSNETTPYAE